MLVINYVLSGWGKKLKTSNCWWGQCVLVVRAVFRICGNEIQQDLQLVEKLATPRVACTLKGCWVKGNICSLDTPWAFKGAQSPNPLSLKKSNTVEKKRRQSFHFQSKIAAQRTPLHFSITIWRLCKEISVLKKWLCIVFHFCQQHKIRKCRHLGALGQGESSDCGLCVVIH